MLPCFNPIHKVCLPQLARAALAVHMAGGRRARLIRHYVDILRLGLQEAQDVCLFSPKEVRERSSIMKPKNSKLHNCTMLSSQRRVDRIWKREQDKLLSAGAAAVPITAAWCSGTVFSHVAFAEMQPKGANNPCNTEMGCCWLLPNSKFAAFFPLGLPLLWQLFSIGGRHYCELPSLQAPILLL